MDKCICMHNCNKIHMYVLQCRWKNLTTLQIEACVQAFLQPTTELVYGHHEIVFDQHYSDDGMAIGINCSVMCFLFAFGPLLSTCHCSG